MKTCKDCIHYDVCAYDKDVLGFPKTMCDFFKDHSRFIELPELEDYTEVITLDEAIDHAYKIAMSPDDGICSECRAEHMRLCGWLGELKHRLENDQIK